MQKKILTAAPADRASFSIARDGAHFTCTVMMQVPGGSPMGVTLQAAQMAAGGLDTTLAGQMLDALYALAAAQLGFEDDGVPYPEPVVVAPEPVPTEPDGGVVA